MEAFAGGVAVIQLAEFLLKRVVEVQQFIKDARGAPKHLKELVTNVSRISLEYKALENALNRRSFDGQKCPEHCIESCREVVNELLTLCDEFKVGKDDRKICGISKQSFMMVLAEKRFEKLDNKRKMAENLLSVAMQGALIHLGQTIREDLELNGKVLKDTVIDFCSAMNTSLSSLANRLDKVTNSQEEVAKDIDEVNTNISEGRTIIMDSIGNLAQGSDRIEEGVYQILAGNEYWARQTEKIDSNLQQGNQDILEQIGQFNQSVADGNAQATQYHTETFARLVALENKVVGVEKTTVEIKSTVDEARSEVRQGFSKLKDIITQPQMLVKQSGTLKTDDGSSQQYSSTIWLPLRYLSRLWEQPQSESEQGPPSRRLDPDHEIWKAINENDMSKFLETIGAGGSAAVHDTDRNGVPIFATAVSRSSTETVRKMLRIKELDPTAKYLDGRNALFELSADHFINEYYHPRMLYAKARLLVEECKLDPTQGSPGSTALSYFVKSTPKTEVLSTLYELTAQSPNKCSKSIIEITKELILEQSNHILHDWKNGRPPLMKLLIPQYLKCFASDGDWTTTMWARDNQWLMWPILQRIAHQISLNEEDPLEGTMLSILIATIKGAADVHSTNTHIPCEEASEQRPLDFLCCYYPLYEMPFASIPLVFLWLACLHQSGQSLYQYIDAERKNRTRGTLIEGQEHLRWVYPTFSVKYGGDVNDVTFIFQVEVQTPKEAYDPVSPIVRDMPGGWGEAEQKIVAQDIEEAFCDKYKLDLFDAEDMEFLMGPGRTSYQSMTSRWEEAAYEFRSFPKTFFVSDFVDLEPETGNLPDTSAKPKASDSTPPMQEWTRTQEVTLEDGRKALRYNLWAIRTCYFDDGEYSLDSALVFTRDYDRFPVPILGWRAR